MLLVIKSILESPLLGFKELDMTERLNNNNNKKMNRVLKLNAKKHFAM